MSAVKHDHGDQDQADAVNWFRVLDVAVWVAVVIVVVIGLEMLVGKVVRERISRDASRFLQKVTLGSSAPGDTKPGDL